MVEKMKSQTIEEIMNKDARKSRVRKGLRPNVNTRLLLLIASTMGCSQRDVMTALLGMKVRKYKTIKKKGLFGRKKE